MLRRKLRSGVIRILRFATSWLSFAARKWFSAAVTIARRCDGRAWNASLTKFLSRISTLQRRLNPATGRFSCVRIEIDSLPGASERRLRNILLCLCSEPDRHSKNDESRFFSPLTPVLGSQGATHATPNNDRAEVTSAIGRGQKRGRKTSFRDGARSPREKGPAAKDRLANRSMAILASVAATEIAPPPRLAPHRSSYGSTQAT